MLILASKHLTNPILFVFDLRSSSLGCRLVAGYPQINTISARRKLITCGNNYDNFNHRDNDTQQFPEYPSRSGIELTGKI